MLWPPSVVPKMPLDASLFGGIRLEKKWLSLSHDGEIHLSQQLKMQQIQEKESEKYAWRYIETE